MEKKVFDELYAVNVNDRTEKKQTGNATLTYLSWAWAWAEVKKRYPDANYTIWKNDHGLPYVYDPNTGYMCYTTVTINGITHEMWLPVMDGANKAMKAEPYKYMVKNPKFRYAKKDKDGKYYDSYGNEQPEYLTKSCDAATMFDVNKTVMRCLTKNLAMFGLGLYIYAGEDLPEDPNVVEEKMEKADNYVEIAKKGNPNKKITEEVANAIENQQKKNGSPNKRITKAQLKDLRETEIREGISETYLSECFGGKRLDDISEAEYYKVINNLELVKKKSEEYMKKLISA